MTYVWIALAAGTVFVVIAVVMSRGVKVKCPACGMTVDHEGLFVGARICPVCGVYAVKEGRSYVRVGDTYVHGAPAFATALPARNIQWPDGCCVCEQPATRMIGVKLVEKTDASFGRDLATRVASFGVLKAIDVHTYAVEVPHCAKHADGADLGYVSHAVRSTSDAPKLGERMLADRDTQATIGILFRSYPYFKKFLALNHEEPRPVI